MQDALPALVLNSEALPRIPMNDTPPTPAFPTSPASDEHLMLAFSKGSAESFNELFLRYKQPIYGFFRRRTADPHHAEELSQETFLVLLRAASRYEPRALQAILTQRTGKISDVLEVEQEIARVRGEIEQMEAEQKNLEHRVDFATIDLKLSEEYKAKLDSPAPAISTQIHNAAVNGYRNVADTLLSIVLFFAEYAPVLFFWLLLFFIPAGLAWRRWRHATAAV